MASVTSLGLHVPIALHYLIQEGLLPQEPLPNSFEWRTYSDNSSAAAELDELVWIERCVVWSRGGTVRKSFRFEIENEPVTQALLTHFQEDSPQSSFRSRSSPAKKRNIDGYKRSNANRERNRALVVFLKTQAHVYFLSGTSHVIHLPFEVESVFAAPNGLIIQRKLRVENVTTAPLKLPRVPQNSFVSSQPQPWSASSSQQSTFSIADLGSPRQLPLPSTFLLGDAWEVPSLRNDSNWPRLFTLTDPLAELGLVVSSSSGGANGNSRRASTKSMTLDPAEEIIFISKLSDFSQSHLQSDNPLVLVVTLNRDANTFSVWRLSYIMHESLSEQQKLRTSSGSLLRRRSSFAPVLGTGASTPVGAGQFGLRESLGGPTANLGSTSFAANDSIIVDKNKSKDFASTLDPDLDDEQVPRRQSRRVSSMLARADLSASHDRSVFSDLAGAATAGPSRRGESFGIHHTRSSFGGHPNSSVPGYAYLNQLNQSLNSHLEAPVDDLLDELRAGGDFEGFHSMGLDDTEFQGLRKEIVLTKIQSIAAEHSNVRYSSLNKPAQIVYKVSAMAAPSSASDDQTKSHIIVCILDHSDRKMAILTLQTHRQRKSQHAVQSRRKAVEKEKEMLIVSSGHVARASGILDACELKDGTTSLLLVLSETPDQVGSLSLQAPWSVLTDVPIPNKFVVSDTRSLAHDSTPRAKREGGFKRVLSRGPRSLLNLEHPTIKGIVDLRDDDGRLHQLRIRLQPQDPHVGKILEACRIALPGSRGGEAILVCWRQVMQWLSNEQIVTIDAELTALMIVLFSMVISACSKLNLNHLPSHTRHRKSKGDLSRSSSGARVEYNNWTAMMAQEVSSNDGLPQRLSNTGWAWATRSDSFESRSRDAASEASHSMLVGDSEDLSFLQRHALLARTYIRSSPGQLATGKNGYLPTNLGRSHADRESVLTDLILGLHLLFEECRLNTATADCTIGTASILLAILSQIVHWLQWSDWMESYDVEDITADEKIFDKDFESDYSILQPCMPPSVYDWIQGCLISRTQVPYITIKDIVGRRSSQSRRPVPNAELWSSVTPRTALFKNLFAKLGPKTTSAGLIEILHSSKINSFILDTLPEAILAPIREAILDCQTNPPSSWSKALLSLIGREDVNMLLHPGRLSVRKSASILAPNHTASMDVQAICASLTDQDNIRAFDSSIEADRQSITRLIFNQDRRFNEAVNILNTSKPTIARCEPEPHWTESDLLEAQKDHVQLLANRTLAIPSGRGLLYFSAHVPLLTERFPTRGFNLHCVMKPTNNTVGVDKNAFTEEKVCWAFFHSGVASGLSISRDTKGIDTSWILYNKPGELSNRHAGFLLALGLNGHLKSVAKWVAFKYLTPKHTMTSIGLLLGLAASYRGTMDSLITRLLSVHVTRMLPPGAAELNLSRLTQTTGIMGIGLLYCDTQHRRMSEIMVSEFEHPDPELEEEPLRNEGYRLAAGFALGFINLGKGSDLRGLHDMKLMERLLRLAVGARKVSLVHVYDKATAAAVVAIALIFMKSEDHALASKIDVPASLLQFDYVRPDVFMLRTVAKHLILWNEIDASPAWVQRNLPKPYKARYRLDAAKCLSSQDLPFFNILTGLCFSIALRNAGSGSVRVRDLLLHYLDQMMRICRLPAQNYDQKLTCNTVRNCQDLLGLSVATVMAGTGDLPIFRRLRAMHGRDDPDTPYGSHLAAHLALGALFLGGGTHTFGTSNIAVASLLVAFYPLFPTSILDNKSHLQAFRHFWVLAAEPRCLVARDVDTSQPVSLPLIIKLKNGDIGQKHTPCLLPELSLISSIATDSPDYWNVVLDLGGNDAHVAAFRKTQTVHVRRRPAYDASSSTFHTTLQAVNESKGLLSVAAASSSSSSSSAVDPLDWIFALPALASLSKAEKALVLPLREDGGSAATVMAGGAECTVVDVRLVLEKASLDSGKKERLLGLRMLFEWAESKVREGKDMTWIRAGVVDSLRSGVWLRESGLEATIEG